MESPRPSLSLIQGGKISEDAFPRFEAENTTPAELPRPQLAVDPADDESPLGSLKIGVRVRGKRSLKCVIDAIVPAIAHLPAAAQQHVVNLIGEIAPHALPKSYRLGLDGEWVNMKMPLPTEKIAVLEQVVEKLRDQIEPCWGRVPERLCWLDTQEKAKAARKQNKFKRQSIRVLQERYHAGERTQELYDAVLALEP